MPTPIKPAGHTCSCRSHLLLGEDSAGHAEKPRSTPGNCPSLRRRQARRVIKLYEMRCGEANTDKATADAQPKRVRPSHHVEATPTMTNPTQRSGESANGDRFAFPASATWVLTTASVPGKAKVSPGSRTSWKRARPPVQPTNLPKSRQSRQANQ